MLKNSTKSMQVTKPVCPKIALMGFRLESNSHAPVCTEEEFLIQRGDALARDLVADAPMVPAEMTGFASGMSDNGDWSAIAISMAQGGAAGPVDHSFFERWLDDAKQRLQAAMPIDGVFLAQHGAVISTGTEDPDGEIFAAVRRIVGPRIPIVSTLDPHTNVSEAMARETDAMVAFQTNPHVDMTARGREAADLMRRLLNGEKFFAALAKLPLTPPSISQNTEGGPLGDHVKFGQAQVNDDVVTVSVCSGFTLADTIKNGASVLAYATNPASAVSAAKKVAERIWEERKRYDIKLMSLEEAVDATRALNADPTIPPLCLADVADNPGGGGRGNTTFILKAMYDAGVTDAIMAPFFDARLAAEAHELGIGATFHARFNRTETTVFSEPFGAEAEVIALHNGIIVGRRGIREGRTTTIGPSALLKCGGIYVVVSTIRCQFYDPVIIESLGAKIDDFRVLVVKSRGHFRASVDEYFTPENIREVDAPGLTTPVLSRVDWKRMPRPMYPLDAEARWNVEAKLC